MAPALLFYVSQREAISQGGQPTLTKEGIQARDQALKIFADELCTGNGALSISRRQLAELMGSNIMRAADGYRVRWASQDGRRWAEHQIRLSHSAAQALMDYLQHRGFCLGMDVPFWVGRKGIKGLRADSVNRILRGI